MSITVADCLKLKSLRGAKVVAGESGLNKIVSSVTVLEYAERTGLLRKKELFVGDELVITAFISVKDDVEAQRRAIRALHACGEVAIVLYYVGIFIQELDPKLLELANELGLPIILMPPCQIDLRYSEVITEVMEAIFTDQKKGELFTSDILDRIGQLKEHQRNIHTVMRMLSDRLRCSLLLTDYSGAEVSFAAWPMAASQEHGPLQEYLHHFGADFHDGKEYSLLEWQNIPIGRIGFTAYKQKRLFLFALLDADKDRRLELQQAAGVIRAFGNIWQYDFCQEGQDALLRAILNDQPQDISRLSELLHIDPAMLRSIWALFDREANLPQKKYHERNCARLRAISRVLREQHQVLLADAFEQTVVAATGGPRHPLLPDESAAQLAEELAGLAENAVLVNCSGLNGAREVREAYFLCERYIDRACRVFPCRRLLYMHELQFTRSCQDIIEHKGDELDWYLRLLEPLENEDRDNSQLIATLSAYLLDAQSNWQKAGELLFVHKNTIKYRLNKIRQILGFDISQPPVFNNLYRAVAIRRLLAP